MQTPEQACEAAIKEAGGVTAMAQALGIKPPSVSGWTVVPVGRVLDIERITGISRHDLRPDIFGPRPSEVRDAA